MHRYPANRHRGGVMGRIQYTTEPIPWLHRVQGVPCCVGDGASRLRFFLSSVEVVSPSCIRIADTRGRRRCSGAAPVGVLVPVISCKGRRYLVLPPHPTFDPHSIPRNQYRKDTLFFTHLRIPQTCPAHPMGIYRCLSARVARSSPLTISALTTSFSPAPEGS